MGDPHPGELNQCSGLRPHGVPRPTPKKTPKSPLANFDGIQQGVHHEEGRHGDEDVMGAIGAPSVEPAGGTSTAQKSYGRSVRDLWRDHVGIKRHDDDGGNPTIGSQTRTLTEDAANNLDI